MGMKFAPGGHSTFFAMLNAFVHIVMYFYYMISAMGPKYQKYIWWKKYLTAFQMVSFRLKVTLSVICSLIYSVFRSNSLLYSHISSNSFGQIVNTLKALWCGLGFTASCSCSCSLTFTNRITSKSKKD